MSPLIENETVDRILAGYAIELLSSSGALVVLEGMLTVSLPDGESHQADPEDPGTVGLIAPNFLHRAVDVFIDGACLIVRAGSGATLNAAPSLDFEAWSLTQGTGERHICEAGGRVVRWSPFDRG